MAPRGRAREMQGGTLTLEKYYRFFIDPWGTRLTIDHLNHIISMHGFVKLYRSNKGDIMRRLVGQVDLQPPRRSTLHRAAAGPSSDAFITADVVSADVDAIGWTECPIGSVAVLAASPGDAPEPVEPDPRPADFVLAGRRARSKRSRSSAYGHRPDDGGSSVEEEKEDGEWLPPPPSTPPRCMRSPTPPPPPPSPPHATPPPPPPPPPRETPRPPQPPQGTLPPPPPPREMVAPPPPPPPPYYGQPTLAPPPPPPPPYCGQLTFTPLPPRPLHFGASPAVVPWLSWGLPLPAVPAPASPFPGAHAFAQHPPPGQRPFWSPPTVPPCYPAPFWGAPFWGAQPPPPEPSPWLHWGHIRSPPAPALQQPPPPTMQLQQQQSPQPQPPPGVFWSRPAY